VSFRGSSYAAEVDKILGPYARSSRVSSDKREVVRPLGNEDDARFMRLAIEEAKKCTLDVGGHSKARKSGQPECLLRQTDNHPPGIEARARVVVAMS